MKKILVLFFLVFSAKAYERSRPIVIAHRGAAGYLPEHTLEGVAMSHAWGVDFIEADVVMTKDKKAIVLHNIELDLTTDVAKKFPHKKRKDGHYYSVDFNLKEIKSLRVNETRDKQGKKRFPNRFPLDQGKFEVPTFEEFLETIQGLNKTTKKNIGVYVEIKKPEFHLKNKIDITKHVVTIMNKYGYKKRGDQAYIQCFHFPTIKRLRNKLKTDLKLVMLIGENNWNESSTDYEYIKSEKGIKEVAKYADGIGPWLKQIMTSELKIKNLTNIAHKQGLLVHPYTHRIEQLPKALSTNKAFFDFLFNNIGVDGIFSDFADIALKYR